MPRHTLQPLDGQRLLVVAPTHRTNTRLIDTADGRFYSRFQVHFKHRIV